MHEGVVRLRDIAREVGVTVSAVSAVLNGKRNGQIRVSLSKAAAIRETANRLHYCPNSNARALVGASSRVLGVLLDSRAPLVDFRLLSEIEYMASQQNYRILVGETHDDVESLYATYQQLLQHGVDGVLCLSHDYPEQRERLETFFREPSPVVFINGEALSNHPSLTLDISSGIRAACEYLLGSGRRRIALITDSRMMRLRSIADRVKGFREALAPTAGVVIDCPGLCLTPPEKWNALLAEVITTKLLPQKIDAVLAMNDLCALALLGQLKWKGIRVPEDMALFGHDNDTFSVCCQPTLSTIDERVEEIAEQAVSMLLQKAPPEEHRLVAPRLVLRGTT